MSQNNYNQNQNYWNNHAEQYDAWYETFEGAVENYVDWHILQNYLPVDKNAKILDAAGGTGRITIPLAKMGYSVTLCDISREMLNIANKKINKEKIANKTDIIRCDIRDLPFPDDSFDFVLCWDGFTEAVAELARVTKTGGIVSIFTVNKWAKVIGNFFKNPEKAIEAIDSGVFDFKDNKYDYGTLTPSDTRLLFESKGIKVTQIYGVCGWLDILKIPRELLEAKDWHESFYQGTVNLVLRLCKEPSIMGLTRHLVVYGTKK